MTDPLDELPDIQIEEMLDEPTPTASAPLAPLKPPSAPAADDGIDIELSLDDVAAPTPSGAAPTSPVVAALPASPKPAPAAKPSSLDLEALLADLDVPPARASEPVSLPEPEAEAEPKIEIVAPEQRPPEPEPASEPAPASAEAQVSDEVEAEFGGDTQAEVMALLGVADADQAPPLPASAEEPPPVSTLGTEELQVDSSTVESLKRLAGAAVDPQAAQGNGPAASSERAREALHAALRGDEYDVDALPDARAIAVGAARLLVKSGFSAAELVDAIMDAMKEGPP